MNDYLLAAVGGPVTYVNVIKIAVTVGLLFVWAAAAQWVDRDTDGVKTRREHWNMIVLAGGGGIPRPVRAAVVRRAVRPGNRVLGVDSRRGAGGLPHPPERPRRRQPSCLDPRAHQAIVCAGKKAAASSKGLRVQISAHDGKSVEPPEDSAEAGDYDTVQDFLYDMLWRRASEVEVVAGKDKCRVVYRVDGVPAELPEGIPRRAASRIFGYLKRIAGLNVEEVRRPQVGRIKCALIGHTGPPGVTEVRTSGTTAGERLALRIQSGPAVMRLPDLGFAAQRVDTVKQLMSKSHGLLILSGSRRGMD